MLDFIGGRAICRRDRNAAALIWAVRAPIVPRRGQADRNWVGSVVAIWTRAGHISVLALRQSRLESLQVDDVWRFASAHRCMASRCLYCTQAGISGYLTLNCAARAGGGIREDIG